MLGIKDVSFTKKVWQTINLSCFSLSLKKRYSYIQYLHPLLSFPSSNTSKNLMYTVNQRTYFQKSVLLHIHNQQHVSAVLATIVRVSERILIKYKINC